MAATMPDAMVCERKKVERVKGNERSWRNASVKRAGERDKRERIEGQEGRERIRGGGKVEERRRGKRRDKGTEKDRGSNSQ